MNTTTAHESEPRIIPMVYLPALDGTPTADNDVVPCDHDSIKHFMVSGFLSLHADAMKKAFTPCMICGYQIAPVYVDADGNQWLPDAFLNKKRAMNTFTVAALGADCEDRLMTQVYVGRI